MTHSTHHAIDRRRFTARLLAAGAAAWALPPAFAQSIAGGRPIRIVVPYPPGGFTDVTARLATHNAGKGAKYTRGRLPVALLYCESAETRSAALKREHAIKQMRADAKRQLIATQDHSKPTQPARSRAKKATTCA